MTHVGELFVIGDHACERGDTDALAAVAERVVERVDEPAHCRLLELARQCADPKRATAAWTRLKEQLQHEWRP